MLVRFETFHLNTTFTSFYMLFVIINSDGFLCRYLTTK